MLKRFISIITIICILTCSSLASVNAAEGDVCIDYSNYISGNPEGGILLQNTQYQSLMRAAGVYGKESEDVSLLAKAVATKESGSHRWEQYRQSFSYMTEGRRYINLSFEIAFGNKEMDRFINVAFANGAELTVQPIKWIYNNNDNTFDLYINSAKKNIPIAERRWTKYNIVFDTELMQYSVYINGAKAQNGVDFALTKAGNITGIKQIQFGINQVWSNAVSMFSDAETYFDNICVTSDSSVGSYIPPSSEVKPEKITHFDYDFTGLEKNKQYKDSKIGNANAADEDPTYFDYVIFDKANGKFGREASDTSLYLHNLESADKPKGWFDQYIAFDVSGNPLECGESTAISFYMAVDDMRFAKSVSTYYTADGVNGRDTTLMNIAIDGSVSVWGVEVSRNKILTEGKWYKFDIITTAGSADGEFANEFEFYVDNRLIARKSFSPKTGGVVRNKFEKFTTVRFGQYTYDNASEKAYESGVYFDDIKIVSYRGGFAKPPITDTGLSAQTNKAIANSFGLQFYDNVTEKVANENISAFTVADDKYPVVTLNDGTRIYSRIIAENKHIIKENFNNCSVDNTVPPSADIDSYFNEMPVGMTWTYHTSESKLSLKYETALGGKAQSDRSMVISADGFNSEYCFPFVNISMMNKYGGKQLLSEAYEPLTIETSVLVKDIGDIRNINLQAMFGGSLTALWRFDKHGNIVNANNERVAKWEKDKWYRIAVTIYPETNVADLYINGDLKSAEYEVKENATHHKMERCKIETQYYPGNMTRYGKAAFDDFEIYTGLYKNKYVPVVNSKKYRVNNSENEIYADASDVAEVLAGENPDADIALVGNILSVEENDIHRYYTVFDQVNSADISYKTDGSCGQNGKFGSGVLEAAAKITLEPNAEYARLYTAVYENSVLTKIGISDKTSGGLVKGNVVIDKPEGKSVRLMVLDDKLKPLCTPVELKPYGDDIVCVDAEYYPGFLRKAVTFSYDDGVIQDEKLVSIFKKYGLAATFNLNSDRHTSEAEKARIKALYEGFDIANHVKNHPDLSKLPLDDIKKNIADGKAELEAIFGADTVCGMAFPGNDPYRTEVTEWLNSGESGLLFARTSESSCLFDIPNNFMSWTSTCHHNALPSLGDEFLALEDDGTLKVLSVWGHSYDYDPDKWHIIEAFGEKLSKYDNVWKVSNTDFVQYINAKNSLIIADNYVENPSKLDLYIKLNGVKTIIKAGEKINK